MAKHLITSYALCWCPDSNKGLIKLKLQGGPDQSLPSDVADFAAFAAILRESPVYWDDAARTLFTDWETPADDLAALGSNE